MEIELPFVASVEQALGGPALIQVVLGPRQVGKTTGIQMLLERWEGPTFFASADGAIPKGPEWIGEQWGQALALSPDTLLVIDEIQKVERWSEALKRLWDAQPRAKTNLCVIVLGSSSLAIQAGLSESLAGRYLLHRVWPWNAEESQRAYQIDLETYLACGGYPGAYKVLIAAQDQPRLHWLSYVRDSIVDAVIARDILTRARVKSPALFRQCFTLACSYAAQEISYNKLLGQLQTRGNVELVKHYLELFEGAFLLRQLFKFSRRPVVRRSSSPKILPTCPALYTITLDAELDGEERGRAFEVAVGLELLRKPGSLYYWRKGNHEVDFIYQFGKSLVAIEVKSGRKKRSPGLDAFLSEHRDAVPLVLTPENYQSAIALL